MSTSMGGGDGQYGEGGGGALGRVAVRKITQPPPPPPTPPHTRWVDGQPTLSAGRGVYKLHHFRLLSSVIHRESLAVDILTRRRNVALDGRCRMVDVAWLSSYSPGVIHLS